MNTSKLTLFVGSILLSCSVNAATVTNVKVQNLYVQSLNGSVSSAAHAVRVDKPLDSSCQDLVYINPLDKELFSTLLAYKASGAIFNLKYETSQPSRTVAGHLEATCKVYSIW